MYIDISLLLQSAYAAFANDQLKQSIFLLNYAIKLSYDQKILRSPSIFDIAICLDRGRIRDENEDCTLAIHGVQKETGKSFGMFIICDGMGGHTNGQEAACIASQTITNFIFPLLMNSNISFTDWRSVLVKGVEQANSVIYAYNQSQRETHLYDMRTRRATPLNLTNFMGTTITVALLVDTTAYIANIGDSRAYLYTLESGLTRITTDHSVVATLLAQKIITEEESYSHPERNQITRSLGQSSSVDVDAFTIRVPDHALLLLCSDGLWEMTRDQQIAAVLQHNWVNVESMASHLLGLATEGGGLDNISLIVVRPHASEKMNQVSPTA